jgi:hypothetical protein
MGLTLKTWHLSGWHRHLTRGTGNPVVVRPRPGVSSRGAAPPRTERVSGQLEGQQS